MEVFTGTSNLEEATARAPSRRELLKAVSSGFGYLAFAALAAQARAQELSGASNPLAPRPPHFAAKAKRIIFLCMRGGPSHVDTFDYKPRLAADSGKSGRRPGTRLLGPKWKFSPHGRGGLWISELFPELAKSSDELCLLRGMQTDLPNHPQAFVKLHTGNSQLIRPSLGAWTLYGLGTLNENLPGFVTLTPPTGFGGAQNYGSSFLPAAYQGLRIGQDNRPIENAEVRNLKPLVSADEQKKELELIQALNRGAIERGGDRDAIEGVIESYELAFKMQSEMPSAMDLTTESKATQELYGIDEAATADFGRKCLLARRLAERGVRFVEISHGNWDHHNNLERSLTSSCRAIDKPLAGLIIDLKERGLLKDTLIVWTGEFGRTPHAQAGDGRDHNNKGFTAWIAGGGVRGGYSHGQTDDYGYEAVEGKVSIHDLHATLLWLLGLDHEKLTYRHVGRDFRLTDIHGEVVRSIIA